jgi:parvulin-like peptidyl-prolyl isomerase
MNVFSTRFNGLTKTSQVGARDLCRAKSRSAHLRGLRHAILFGVLALSACNDLQPPPSATPQINIVLTKDSGISVQINVTPVPTATPTPAAAVRVNGEDVTVERFNAELRRYVLSQPNAPAFDSLEGQQLAAQFKDTVLDALVEQKLIEQEALRSNVNVTDQQVQQELNVTREKAGGDDKFLAWLTANQQTEQDAREQIKLDLLTNALTAKVLVELPRTAEYVHAYHIVVASEGEAEQLLGQINNGAKFTALAESKSIDDSTRADGGDLDWFTRGAGSVLWTEVEDAAFALQPDEVSPVIKSPIGYHLIKVIAREVRQLTEADTTFFQQSALKQWMDGLKAGAKIEKII